MRQRQTETQRETDRDRERETEGTYVEAGQLLKGNIKGNVIVKQSRKGRWRLGNSNAGDTECGAG